MKPVLLLFYFLLFAGPARSQVEIVRQHFDYVTFTYDITLVNRDTGNVLLTEIVADYEVYVYIIWMGLGDPPRVKSSAAYQLPVYLARGCADPAHVNGRIHEDETGPGLWTCQSSIRTDPALLLPPNRQARFQVQLKPEGFKAYLELEADLQLSLHFDHGQATKMERIPINSQDIMGFFLAGRILKKDRVMRLLEGKEEPEHIRLSDGLGKLEYTFDKSVATCHLHKFDLPADSIVYWLRRMLQPGNDDRTQAAACKMIRKYRLSGLTGDLRRLCQSDPQNSSFYVESEALYTLYKLGDTAVLERTFTEYIKGKRSEYAFLHFEIRNDPVFYGELVRFLQNRSPSPAERVSALGDLYGKLTRFHTPETTRLWRQALETDTVPEVVYAVIGGLKERLSKRLAGDTLAYTFAPFYPKLYESSRSYDRENLLYLLCRTGDAAQAEHYLKKAMLDPGSSLRQYAVGLLTDLEASNSPPASSTRHWMWDLARLRHRLDSVMHDSAAYAQQTRYKLRRQTEAVADSIITIARGALNRAEELLCRPDNIMAMPPEDALLLASWVDYEKEGSWSRHPRRQAVLTAICRPAGLKKMSAVQLGILANMLYENRDSAELEAVVQALESRVQGLKRKPLPAAELLEAARVVEQMLGTMHENDPRRRRWYSLTTAFYEAIPASFQPAARPVAEWYTSVAWFELESGRPEKALAAAERAMAGTNSQYARVLYAHALLLNGRTGEARALYEGLKKETCVMPGYFYGESLKETLSFQLRGLVENNAVPAAKKQGVEAIIAWLEN